MAHYRAELTGVFGDPVDDNPTCVLEEAAYAALGLNYRYLTIKVLPEDLETAMASVRAMHFRGINLTMPHKIKVIPMLDELSRCWMSCRKQLRSSARSIRWSTTMGD